MTERVRPLDTLLAASEVVGRHVVEHVPDLRGRVGVWARRAPVEGKPLLVGDLAAAIRAAGVGAGRDLLVHCSWAGMRQLKAKPSDVITMLRASIGESATLVMPAHPIEKEEDGLLVYDVEKTPSRMGMLSESMRRVPGVKRSPVPLAPVFAVGPASDAYTRDYREASKGTPWGVGSPWWEIGERMGQVLILGVDFVRTLTLLHVAFDVLGDANPIADYYESIDYVVRMGGREERWTLRRQRRSLERQLATVAFSRMVLRSGTVRTTTLSGLKIATVDAKAFLDWHLPVARATGLPYWGFSRRGLSSDRASKAAE